MRIFIYALALSFVTATNVKADEYCDPKFLLNTPLNFRFKSDFEENTNKFLKITKREEKKYSYEITEYGRTLLEQTFLNTFNISDGVSYDKDISEFNLLGDKEFSITQTYINKAKNQIIRNIITVKPIKKIQYKIGQCLYDVIVVNEILKNEKEEYYFEKYYEPNSQLLLYTKNLKSGKRGRYLTNIDIDLYDQTHDLNFKDSNQIRDEIKKYQIYYKNGGSLSRWIISLLLTQLDDQESENQLTILINELINELGIEKLNQSLTSSEKEKIQIDYDKVLLGYYKAYDKIGLKGYKLEISNIYENPKSMIYNLDIAKHWKKEAEQEFNEIMLDNNLVKKMPNTSAIFIIKGF